MIYSSREEMIEAKESEMSQLIQKQNDLAYVEQEVSQGKSNIIGSGARHTKYLESIYRWTDEAETRESLIMLIETTVGNSYYELCDLQNIEIGDEPLTHEMIDEICEEFRTGVRIFADENRVWTGSYTQDPEWRAWIDHTPESEMSIIENRINAMAKELMDGADEDRKIKTVDLVKIAKGETLETGIALEKMIEAKGYEIVVQQPRTPKSFYVARGDYERRGPKKL